MFHLVGVGKNIAMAIYHHPSCTTVQQRSLPVSLLHGFSRWQTAMRRKLYEEVPQPRLSPDPFWLLQHGWDKHNRYRQCDMQEQSSKSKVCGQRHHPDLLVEQAADDNAISQPTPVNAMFKGKLPFSSLRVASI